MRAETPVGRTGSAAGESSDWFAAWHRPEDAQCLGDVPEGTGAAAGGRCDGSAALWLSGVAFECRAKLSCLVACRRIMRLQGGVCLLGMAVGR